MTINRSNSYQNLTGRGMYIELPCLSGNNYGVEMIYIALKAAVKQSCDLPKMGLKMQEMRFLGT